MKRRFKSTIGSSFVFAAAWMLAQTAASAATLTVTPAAISNTYSGSLTLQIGGLTSGETVRVKKFMDVNANGILDAGDVLVQSFLLTDGQVSMIGGVTNINVPGDYTPTNGTIVTPLNFQAGGVIQALSGQYAYVVSSPTALFAPVTNLFNVTNSADAQSFTGTVLSSGTNVPYAGVMLFTPPSGDGGMNFIAGTLANSSGAYTLPAPAGTYMLMVTRSGFIADLSVAPVLTLGTGATINTNLSLIAATRTISGRVVDFANTNQGLSALMIICESSSGLLAIGTADNSGNFTVPVTDGLWSPGTDDRQVAFYGYLRLSNKASAVNTTTGNVSGVSIVLPRSTALIYGSVKDALNNPLAGVRLHSNQDNGSGPYESDATADSNGNYVLGAVAGTWQASVDNNNPAYPGYLFSQMDNTNLSTGQAVLQNFVGIAATNHITGFVRDGVGNPITNLNVYAHADINSATFNANATTDSSGNYSLNVANGTWSVGLNCQHLADLGLQCPNEKSTNVLNGNLVVNFTISTLSITTTNLPDGTNGVFYSQQYNASGGQLPYTWTVSPSSSLPGGLALTTNGILSGTLTGLGGFGLSVRVTDNQGATADQMLLLYINPAPLQITTTSLPNGTNGLYYDQPLNATGGQMPYNWYLPNGSITLPPGLDFNTNGVLFGTPTTNGTFNFQVAVYTTNPSYMVSTQSLSLTIAPAPLQITTTSPLPTATRDSFYTATLYATGGQPAYTWTLTPGSPGLPTGLTLSTNGILSGTPTVSGGFWFIARVTDSVLATHDLVLGLMINDVSNPSTVTLTAPSQPGPGRFQFSFNTSAGTNYTIQYSADLQIWNSILTLSGSGAPLTIIDPNATVSQRFYRVKIGL